MHFVLLFYFPVSKKAVVLLNLNFITKVLLNFRVHLQSSKIYSPFLFPLEKVFGFLAF